MGSDYEKVIDQEIEELRLEIERLKAENEMLRNGDTCGRACEGAAYRIEAQRLKKMINDAPVVLLRGSDIVYAVNEKDFAALYALSGKRVRIIVDGDK